jgi:hypothetical protein
MHHANSCIKRVHDRVDHDLNVFRGLLALAYLRLAPISRHMCQRINCQWQSDQSDCAVLPTSSSQELNSPYPFH